MIEESLLKSSTFLRVLGFVLIAAPFAAQAASDNSGEITNTSDGVTLHSSAGTLRVAVCSERVIHVVASPTDDIPDPIVPAAILHCGDTRFTASSTGAAVSIRTRALRAEIDRATNSIHFYAAAGDTILNEQPSAGRSLVPENTDGTQTYTVRQDFLLSPGESLYGLGQHQEGFFDIRDIPIRLLQANTNIAIPFLISTRGYGLL